MIVTWYIMNLGTCLGHMALKDSRTKLVYIEKETVN